MTDYRGLYIIHKARTEKQRDTYHQLQQKLDDPAISEITRLSIEEQLDAMIMKYAVAEAMLIRLRQRCLAQMIVEQGFESDWQAAVKLAKAMLAASKYEQEAFV